ncbi:WD40-repeat-containing domain protein [Phycomyces nitens]|nr:WD40-repeat-containing domain protein [Phycomyces nitens]
MAQDDLSSSLGGSSVGSLSSLFSKGLRHHSHAKRPKNSLAKQKSSFINKVIVHDQLTKILSGRTSEDNYMFTNIGMNFMWTDGKNKECLTNIVFSNAYPTCHDLNRHTSSTMEHMDIIIGFSSGDFIWYDPISHKYSRFNKNGILNNSAVTTVKWIPESEDLFLAGFEDGTMLIIDKERDDQSLSIPVVPNTWADEHTTSRLDTLFRFKVSKPYRHSKYNPVSHWRVSKKAITAFCFSPDGSHVAVAGQDGLMKIIQYNQEKLCDIYMGYFGKINCVAWSPDGKYILTGGQDDLVAIWSFPEQRIVARCQGHKSWVNGVAFDPWRFDGKVYRFASIGEDCNLIMWDFSVNALHRPKQRTSRLFNFNHPKNASETTGNGKTGKRTSVGITFNGSMWSLEAEETLHTQLPVFHRFLNKSQVPFLQPVSIQTIHADPCVDIVFRKDSIHTTDRRGRVRKWDRPK